MATGKKHGPGMIFLMLIGGALAGLLLHSLIETQEPAVPSWNAPSSTSPPKASNKMLPTVEPEVVPPVVNVPPRTGGIGHNNHNCTGRIGAITHPQGCILCDKCGLIGEKSPNCPLPSGQHQKRK